MEIPSAESMLMFVANLGAIVFVIKRVLNRVDEHSDIIPKISATLDANLDTQKEIKGAIRDLYESRGRHRTEIEVIKNTCEIKKAC